METTLHAYYFDTRNKADKVAYAALCSTLNARGSKVFCSWGRKSTHYATSRLLDGKILTLETDCLFDNQWNTAPITGVSDSGYRVFDWAEDYPIDFSPAIKRGYWLDLTDEMRTVRHETLKCRYCGKQVRSDSGLTFCPMCLDSVYLKAEDLHLTRLMRVDDTASPAPLSEAEKAERLLLWSKAQTYGATERGKKQLANKRREIERKYKQRSERAQTENDGFLWLLEHGAGMALIDNCIYYSHTDLFNFGWRNPIAEGTLGDILTGFPYAYEITTPDGKLAKEATR